MNIFDNLFGNWIKIVDKGNELTIENYEYSTGVIEGTTGNHCVKCVATNQCWFRNEKDKKPEKFNLTGIGIFDGLINGVLPGLYHWRCHCVEYPIEVFEIDKIQLIVPAGKIDWLFTDKGEWVKSMGYELNNLFIDILCKEIKQAYFYGKYIIQSHNNYGVKININVDLNGINDKNGKVYKLISSFTVFPNGKIKCNTLIGGWQK